jgi:tellurite resistance protein
MSGNLAMSDRRAPREALGPELSRGLASSTKTIPVRFEQHGASNKGATMPRPQAFSPFPAAPPPGAVVRDDVSQDDVLDAIVSMAALIARADGWVQEVELRQLVDFVNHFGLLAACDREELLERFERRVRELRDPDGPFRAFQRLVQLSDHPTADLMLSVGNEIAAADRRLDPREEQLLRLFRTRLQRAAI